MKILKSLALTVAVVLTLSLFGCEEINLFPSDSGSYAVRQTVSLSHSAAELEIGGELALIASVSDGEEVVWSTSDSSIATVDGGIVRGVSAGNAEIAATASSARASCLITVKESAVHAELFLPITSAQLEIGGVLELPVFGSSTVVWASSAPQTAVVDGGTVVGVSAGVAKITAQAGDAIEECIITVAAGEKSATLSLPSYSVSVQEGQSRALYATASDGSAVTWMTDDAGIASVSGGILSGLKVGKTVISAWTAKASVKCEVTVRDPQDTHKDDFVLVWNDEFSGSALDESKWVYMLGVQDEYGVSRGPWFWGNNEQQYYTREAATVSDGALHITAKRESKPNDRGFSSARIATRDKGFWTYGYFEARMKTPPLRGMWPAFWMLPQPTTAHDTSNKYGGWAANGEIDIMEARGSVKNYADTTLHFGNSGYSTYKTHSTRLSSNTDEWHVYALDWRENYMAWYIDGLEVMRVESSEWWSSAALDSETAPFDVDFYLLLNLAVGGNYDRGTLPDDDFTSAEMLVDYVRVYKHA